MDHPSPHLPGMITDGLLVGDLTGKVFAMLVMEGSSLVADLASGLAYWVSNLTDAREFDGDNYQRDFPAPFVTQKQDELSIFGANPEPARFHGIVGGSGKVIACAVCLATEDPNDDSKNLVLGAYLDGGFPFTPAGLKHVVRFSPGGVIRVATKSSS